MNDTPRVRDQAALGAATGVTETAHWRCQYRLEKRWGDWTHEQVIAGLASTPYEVIERDGKLVTAHGRGNDGSMA